MAEMTWPRVRHWLNSQLSFHPPVPTRSFAGQTVIVTGSNTGMGLEAARHLVRLNAARVVLAVRDLTKGEAAAESIRSSSPGAGGSTGAGSSGSSSSPPTTAVEVWHLDLASYASVVGFAARAGRELDRLDVVVCNAGIVVGASGFQLLEEDEATITVNVVSTLLLGVLLLPKLRQTSVAHAKEVVLTFVGSFVHLMTEFPERKSENIFGDLADEDKARMPDRYNVSKLIQLLLVRRLAREVTKSSEYKPGRVTVSVVNPGFVKTNLMKDHTVFYQMYSTCLAACLSHTTEEGGSILINAAEGGEDTHGQYLDDCKVGTPSAFVTSEEGEKVGEQLWGELAAKLEAIHPGIMDSI